MGALVSQAQDMPKLTQQGYNKVDKRYMKQHSSCAKAGHVNPQLLILGNIGTVYSRPNALAALLGCSRQHSRSWEKHSTTARVFPYTPFVL